MKKTLALLAFVLLFSTGAMAQLNVTSSHENTTEKLGRELRYDTSDNTYYLVLKTSNQFDDVMIFKLGASKDSATITLKDLNTFLKDSEKGDIIMADNGYGHEYKISKYDNNNLMITAKGYAGHCFVWTKKIERWQLLIETHGEE